MLLGPGLLPICCFGDVPDIEFVGESPKAAIGKLLEAGSERISEARSITVDEPDSGSRLNFSVDGIR